MAFSSKDIKAVQVKRANSNNFVYDESVTDKIKYIVLSRPVAYLVAGSMIVAPFILMINKVLGM